MVAFATKLANSFEQKSLTMMMKKTFRTGPATQSESQTKETQTGLQKTQGIIERSNLMFLSHKFRLCLTEQMIFIAFKKRSSQI